MPLISTALREQITAICGKDSHTMPCTPTYNTGDPGLHLEGLFGVEVNSRDTADLALEGVELKYTSSNATPITMLHLDPTERTQRGSVKDGTPRVPSAVERLIINYGYINDDGVKAFRHMIRGGTPSTGDRVKGFFVKVEDEQINVYHVSQNRPVVSWKSDAVTNAIVSKMRRVLTVDGERDNAEVSYNKATFHYEPRSSQILNLIAEGTILIDFDARFKPNGSVRNHGVKFRIYRANLPKLYWNSEVVCDHTT